MDPATFICDNAIGQVRCPVTSDASQSVAVTRTRSIALLVNRLMGWILDRLTLRPTKHAIDVDDGERRSITYRDAQVELIVREVNSHVAMHHQLVVMKFVGAGGRAENFSDHPFDEWHDVRGHVYSMNPPGYGRSPGVASMDHMVQLGIEALQHAATEHPEQRVLLSGSSLGAAVALGVAASSAAKDRVCGLLLRDPPQLAEVVMQRFGWWTGWWPAKLVADRTPDALDAKQAAEECEMPALFVTSGADSIVPLGIQQAIVDRYAGSKQTVHLPTADHGEPFTEDEFGQYRTALDWLREATHLHAPTNQQSANS